MASNKEYNQNYNYASYPTDQELLEYLQDEAFKKKYNITVGNLPENSGVTASYDLATGKTKPIGTSAYLINGQVPTREQMLELGRQHRNDIHNSEIALQRSINRSKENLAGLEGWQQSAGRFTEGSALALASLFPFLSPAVGEAVGTGLNFATKLTPSSYIPGTAGQLADAALLSYFATEAGKGAYEDIKNPEVPWYDKIGSAGTATIMSLPFLKTATEAGKTILETDLAGNLSKVNRFAENIASKTTPETAAALERPRTVFAAPAPKIKVQDNVITFKGNRMSPENMREGTIVQIGNDPLNAPKAIITHRVDRNPHFNFLKTENVGEAEIPQLAEAVNNNFPTKNLVATSYKDIDKKLANQAFGNTEDYAVTFDNRGNPIYRKRSEWEKRINARNSTPWETTDHYGLDLGNAKTLANDVKLFSKYRTKSEAVNLIKMKYPNLTDQEALNLYTLIMNAPPESVASHLGLHPIVVENARLNTAQLLHNNSSPLDINNLAAYGLPEPRIIGGQLAPVNLDSRGQLKGTYASFANITPTGQYAINYVDAYPVTPYVTKNGEFMMPVGNNANTGIFVHPAERRITPTLNPQFYQNLATGEIQASKIDNNIFLPWFKQLLSISRNPNFKGYTILNDSRPRKIDLANLKWNSPIQGDAYDENIGYIINQIPTNGLSADSNGLFPRLAKRMYGDEAGQHLYQSPAIVDYNMSTYDNVKVSDAIRQASTSDEMKKAINEILNPYLKEIGLSPSIYNGFMNEKPIGTVPFIVLKNGGKINKKNKFK